MKHKQTWIYAIHHICIYNSFRFSGARTLSLSRALSLLATKDIDTKHNKQLAEPAHKCRERQMLSQHKANKNVDVISAEDGEQRPSEKRRREVEKSHFDIDNPLEILQIRPPISDRRSASNVKLNCEWRKCTYRSHEAYGRDAHNEH